MSKFILLDEEDILRGNQNGYSSLKELKDDIERECRFTDEDFAISTVYEVVATHEYVIPTEKGHFRKTVLK